MQRFYSNPHVGSCYPQDNFVHTVALTIGMDRSCTNCSLEDIVHPAVKLFQSQFNIHLTFHLVPMLWDWQDCQNREFTLYMPSPPQVVITKCFLNGGKSLGGVAYQNGLGSGKTSRLITTKKQSLAHELGHIFGAVHTLDGIMNPEPKPSDVPYFTQHFCKRLRWLKRKKILRRVKL